MTSIPVPALEAPPDEPSGTKIGAVVIAFALGTAVSIGLGRPPSTNERLRCVRAAAHTVGPWGQHRRVFQRRRSEGGAGLSRAGPHPPGRDGDGTLWAVRGAWVGAVHRWSGRLAVLISVPVSAVPVCHGLPDLRRSGDRTLTIRLFLLWSFCFQNVDPDSR